MALIELNLEKPALKRTEPAESSGKEQSKSRSSKSMSGTKMASKSGESSSKVVEIPEGEQSEKKSSGGGGIIRRIATLGALAGAIFAVRRFRSRRKKQSNKSSEFEEEWETARSE